MRRRLALLLAVLFFATAAFSQSCIVSTAADSGLVFPAADTFPCIDAGQPYSNAIQIRMPGAFHGIINIDSMVITSITGLPSGISYAFNPSLTLYPDSNTCISFYGTTNDSLGTYPLTFNGYAVITTDTTGTQTYSLTQLAQISDAPIPTYQLTITYVGDTSCNKPVYTGISSTKPDVGLSIYPNPGNGLFQISVKQRLPDLSWLVINDMLGKTIYTQAIQPDGSFSSSLDLTKYAKGVYILLLKSGSVLASEKIVIE